LTNQNLNQGSGLQFTIRCEGLAGSEAERLATKLQIACLTPTSPSVATPAMYLASHLHIVGQWQISTGYGRIQTMLAKQELDRLRGDIVKVSNEVHALWFHHDFFWRVMKVVNENKRLQESGGLLIKWLKHSYIEAGCVGLRRQLDQDKRSVSLRNVLKDLKREAKSITQDQFVGFIAFAPNSAFHNPTKYKIAQMDFTKLFGTLHLDGSIVQSDVNLLLKEGDSIKELVNKEIAHLDRTGMRNPKPSGHHFEKCLNHLEQVTRKYFYLLMGEHSPPLRTGFEEGFPEDLFTFAWIEK
jgi:hypothetical protein